MAKPKYDPYAGESFDVICVIGTVIPREQGEHSPQEAAFLLIAQHGAEGSYGFPLPDGTGVAVAVEYHRPPEAVEL